MDESKILILYCGGTLGMVRHPSQGYVPYPGFLTETLRTQNRFHDPLADSIFSWSSTTERYRLWSEAKGKPLSGASTPYRSSSPTHQTREATTKHVVHSSSGTSHNPDAAQDEQSATLTTQDSQLQPFCPPVKVVSSSVKGTFVKNSVSHRINENGLLELMLPTLITPSAGRRRTRYAVLEYDPLLDSSNIETKDWLRLAADISLNYQAFDAFVILHGTDTMSYTSSALSMLLENLGKPVIVTGAQVPLSELRNDAIENVLGALILASSNPIPEVTLFFSSTLFRGNRVSKLSNATLDAFDSPNLAALATAGIHIQVNQQLIFKPRHISPFRAHNRMSQQVVLLRLFPGLQVDTIENFFKAPIEGVVLHSFGAGNAPTKPELLEVFRKATQERGIVIVNISQCIRGEVSAIYEVGKRLQSVGVVAGGDMTPECALTKLSYLLAKDELSKEQIRALMGKSLRGELTERQAEFDEEARKSITPNGDSRSYTNGMQARRFLESILVDAGNPSTSIDEDIDELAIAAERGILPYQIQQAVVLGNDASLQAYLERQRLLDRLPQFSLHTSENVPVKQSKQPSANIPSMALHIAASMGHAEQVRMLLQAGYLLHQRDYAGRTPLYLAARNGQMTTVELLRAAGAHLAVEEVDLAHFNLIKALKAAVSEDEKERIRRVWTCSGLRIENHAGVDQMPAAKAP